MKDGKTVIEAAKRVAKQSNNPVVKQLVELIDHLWTQTERLRELTESQQQKIEEQQETIEEQQQTIEDQKHRINALSNWVEDVDDRVSDGGTTVPAEVDLELSNIERWHLVNAGGENPTESIRDDRALTIYENLAEWSQKTPKGHVIQTGQAGLLRLMRTARPDDKQFTDWKQVYRACERLAEESDGNIEWHDEENRLLVPDASELHYAPDHRQPSSPAT